MTGARFIAEMFQGYGVSHVFFMPVIAIRALLEMERLGIKRVMAHGEKAAAYMADGYARVRRGTGVCMAQSVGAANLAAGLQDAFLACSPVMALTGRQSQINQHRHAYQEVDHVKFFDSVTKYSVLVDAANQLPYFLRQAFRETVSGTPGPVHLDLGGRGPLSFLGQLADEEADLEVVIEEAFSKVPPFRPEPDTASVLKAVKLLAQTERPVIVAGGGVTYSGAGEELIELAEKLSIPVATSLNAKETFPSDHPLAVGVCGLYARDCANQTVGEADLVFFIGSHTGGQVTNEWRIPRQGTHVIQLDINPAELGRSFPIVAGLHGDVQASLRKMIDLAEPMSHADWVVQVQGFVKAWKDKSASLINSDEIPMRPERLCREITDALPSDAILVSDTGHAGVWSGTMIDLQYPTQNYVRCAGSLGWGLPAAIGAKCAAPDRPVVCFAGDGGMWYHLTELETALRCGINTVTVVNNNHSLNQEQKINEMIYGGRSAGSDELWVFPEPDFAKIAESMGCLGLQVNHPGEFSGVLDQALSAGRPSVVDVKTHIEGIAPKPWEPK